MFKEMLSEKEFDFNALEKEIFRIGCEFAAGLMEQLLVRMDEHLMRSPIKLCRKKRAAFP